MKALTHYWRVRTTLAERHGQPCRIIARAAGPAPTITHPAIVNASTRRAPANILIEFADGVRHVVSRYAVRRLPLA